MLVVELPKTTWNRLVSKMESKLQSPKGAKYHDTLASEWTTGYAGGGFGKRFQFIEHTLKPLVGQGARWLDLGCGSGILTRYLERLGAIGLAVDGSSRMIMAAISESESAGLDGFHYQQIQTVEHLDFPSASFDGILCSSVLEYVDTPGKALNEISRVLKPGGHLFLSVPNKFSFIRVLQKVVRQLGRLIGREYFSYLDVSKITYSKNAIISELESRSIKVHAVSYFDPLLPDWAKLILPPSLIFIQASRV